MATAASLYGLFGVPPTCTDDELRRAYHCAVLKDHPDLNRDQIEAATVKTQQLVSAYEELKDRRQGTKITREGYEFTVRYSFFSGVDIKDIASRKTTFRNEWEKLRQNPSDPVSALRLVHAAFRAEGQDSLTYLLLNPILIDSAPLLLSLFQEGAACETLMRWSVVLLQSQRPREAVQILEDALATKAPLPSVANELRHLHYAWAQYSDPTTGSKATPEVRIEHLRRILELGFKYDYIYKYIAEAYHDLGDDEQARAYLRQAYELNPELSGTVRLSRALGFSQSSTPSSRKTESPSKHKYSRPEEIPSSAQVHEWTQKGNWDAVIEFASPQDYSPRILPKARDILRQIASSLEGCKGPKAIEVLTALLNFSYYWDVSEAAMTSLSTIGDKRTLDLLEEFRARNSRGSATLEACISYLRARVSNQISPATKDAPRVLLAQAERAFEQKKTMGRRGCCWKIYWRISSDLILSILTPRFFLPVHAQ